MTSKSIYIPENQRIAFKPTFLYIKQCSTTGTLYFGKTAQKDPVTYRGSGKHWRLIYKKYGRENIKTIWYCLFTDIDLLCDFAVKFSTQQDIVKSPNWANLKEENGLDGGGDWDETKRKAMAERKRFVSEETRKKMSISAKNKPKITEEARKNMSLACRGIPRSEETRKKNSESMKRLKRVYKEDGSWNWVPRTD